MNGWFIQWETGEIRPVHRTINGEKVKVGEEKVLTSFRTTSHERAEEKVKELQKNGFHVTIFSKAIF